MVSYVSGVPREGAVPPTLQAGQLSSKSEVEFDLEVQVEFDLEVQVELDDFLGFFLGVCDPFLQRATSSGWCCNIPGRPGRH